MNDPPAPRRRFRSNLPLLVRRPLLFARAYRWPLAVLAVGAVADAATTHDVLSSYGAGVELHPVQRLFAHLFGTSAAAVAGMKLVQTAFVVFVAALWRRWCAAVMVLCGVLYALAAVSNHFRLL